MTIINYSLPETGVVELKFEIRISAENARRLVNRWLLNDVSMQMRPLEPQLVIDHQIVWRVPIAFGVPDFGQLGDVGYVDVDVELGQIANSAEKEAELIESAELLTESLPQYQPKQSIPAEFLYSLVQ